MVEKLFHRIVLHDSGVHHPESLLGKTLLKLNSRTSAKSHVVAYSISKLDKVVNLTTWCYTPFTISQIRHALEILLLRQLVVLPGTQNLQTSISKPFACPPSPLPAFSSETFPLFLFLWNRSLKISSNRCTRFKPPPLATFSDHHRCKLAFQIRLKELHMVSCNVDRTMHLKRGSSQRRHV